MASGVDSQVLCGLANCDDVDCSRIGFELLSGDDALTSDPSMATGRDFLPSSVLLVS